MTGIPTVLITVIPDSSKPAGPPRAFYPKGFKPGNSLGGPFQVELQRKVLRDALSRLEAREEPGTIWEREYPEYTGHDESWKKALEEG
jgi:D-proline reductase (dithiol) PrdB